MVLLVVAVVLPPASFLGVVAWREARDDLPGMRAGFDDASRMVANRPGDVIEIVGDKAEAEREIVEQVKRAQLDRVIAVAGASHSMGGQSLVNGGVVLDLRALRHMSLGEDGTLTVGAGARWRDIIPFLDERGRAVKVMQSNNDFSVGGSLSVNCHGWQPDSPPIVSTVRALRVVIASGDVVRCSRTEHGALFAHVIGGYGLFGVILEAELETAPNEFYRAESRRVKPHDYTKVWSEVAGDPDVGMAYGRLSVAPSSFLEEGVVVGLRREKRKRVAVKTLTSPGSNALKRVIFRGSVGSDYGKNLRWRLEKWFGETGGVELSRNQIMNEPSSWFSNRDPAATEILHEYFVPHERLAEFVETIRPILRDARADLLNVTVRSVERDTDSALAYAREPMFGLVMLFHQGRDEASERAMEALTGKLIEAALACGGTYYLPYRPHATREQFARAYPQAEAFFAAKRDLDRADVFQNQFYQKYGRKE
jgi:FAD/FMN-containing dehydrogenase